MVISLKVTFAWSNFYDDNYRILSTMWQLNSTCIDAMIELRSNINQLTSDKDLFKSYKVELLAFCHQLIAKQYTHYITKLKALPLKHVMESDLYTCKWSYLCDLNSLHVYLYYANHYNSLCNNNKNNLNFQQIKCRLSDNL